MRYDRVHTVWDYYDGVKTGTADLNGSPHYFDRVFNEVEDEYSDQFRLFPVEPDFVRVTQRQNEIFLAWLRKFHGGEAGQNTHPGYKGIDAEYDELSSWLDSQLPRLQELPVLYTASFRSLTGEDKGGYDAFAELEVAWSPVAV